MDSTRSSLPQITVLISGVGTNLQSLLEATASPSSSSSFPQSQPQPQPQPPVLPARITHVISNRRDAPALSRTQQWRASHPEDRHMRISYHNLRAYRLAVDRERAGAAEGAENAAGSTAGSAGGDAGRDAGGDAGGDAVQTPADATTGVVVPVVAAAQTARAQAAPGQAAESQGVGSGAGPGDAEEENQLRNRLARQRYDADLAALILGLPLRYLPAHSSTLSPTHPAHPSQNPPPPHTSTPTTSPTAPNTITDPIPPTASAAPDLVILAGFMHILSPSFLTPLNTHTPGSVPVLNLHPALPGAYDGANALSRAWTDWEQGARVVPALPPRSSRSSERGRSRSASASAPSGEGKSEAGERRDEDRTAAAVSSTPSDPPKPERRRIAYTGCMVHHVISEVDRGPPVLARKVSFRVGEAREDFERRFRVDENRLVVDAVRVFLAGNGGEGKEGGRWFGVLGEEGMVYLQI